MQLYEPLILSRVQQLQQHGCDTRDLTAVARQALLQAAARFDHTRLTAARGGVRLAALADRHIRTALYRTQHEVSNRPAFALLLPLLGRAHFKCVYAVRCLQMVA